jgi:hypothetical protein
MLIGSGLQALASSGKFKPVALDQIRTAGNSYGRGYVEADKQWRDLLAGFDWLRRSRNMIVVLIARADTRPRPG